MSGTPITRPPPYQDHLAIELQLREMNEALLLSAVRQHELAEQAEKADALVRESNARFESLFDASPVGMYLVDAELRIRLVSRTARPVLGDNGELIGSDFVAMVHSLWPPKVADEIVARFRHTLETGEPYIAPNFSEERYDSKVREYYDWQIQRIALPGGQYGVVCYFIDISARVFAEQSMRANEQRLRFVMDSMPQKIFTAKPDGDLDYFNPQWAEFTGLSYKQMKDSGWTKLVHPDDVDEKMRLWTHAFDTGEPFQSEHRFRRADGEYRWHFSRAVPMRDEAGRITMWVGSNTDVHDIKQAEQALHDSEVRYRRLFEVSHDGILILDAASGTILDANPYMSELLGYSHNEFLGKELWEIGLFYDRSASEVAMRELQEKSDIRYEHLPLETSQGRKIEVEVVANVYREEYRTVIQCNIRDITERSLMQRKLSEQALALTDLHRRKDEFLAMLSHELRNPLAPISNAVHLLRLQNNEDPLQQQARAIIERQVGQLVRLVDDLLEISRINTGRIHLHQERITLDGIAKNAVETVRPLIGQRRHSLETSLPPQPIWLYGDAARLEQVIVNLLTNAAKYMDEGGHIWLTVAQEGDQAVLRVRDTGVGIAPELLPRIFDLFTQAERSLDRSQGGLGIGLSLVQRLLEMHRGTVEVYSEVGQGSEFVVRLPVVLSPAPSPPPSSEATAATGSSLRVLVVDDNVDVTTTLAMLLKLSGHDVRKAHDGPAALEAALDFRPNVVLLDIGLPGMSGFEVAQQMRQQPDLQNVVLVAMTGYGQESDRRRSLEAGFNHHLVKPADFDKLQKILATVSEQVT